MEFNNQLKVSRRVFPSVPSTQFSMRKTMRLRGERANLLTMATTPWKFMMFRLWSLLLSFSKKVDVRLFILNQLGAVKVKLLVFRSIYIMFWQNQNLYKELLHLFDLRQTVSTCFTLSSSLSLSSINPSISYFGWIWWKDLRKMFPPVQLFPPPRLSSAPPPAHLLTGDSQACLFILIFYLFFLWMAQAHLNEDSIFHIHCG